MKCERRDIAIAKLAGGDLSKWRSARLQRHLDTCPRCSTLFTEIKEQRATARDAHTSSEWTTAPSLVDAVQSRIVDRYQREHPSRVRVGIVGTAVLAALLIGAVVLQLSAHQSPTSGQTPIAMTSDNHTTQTPTGTASAEPSDIEHADVIIRIATNNPDIVIHWLGDSAGGL